MTDNAANPDIVAWRLSAVEAEVKEVRKEFRENTTQVMLKLDGIASGFACLDAVTL